MTSFHRQRGYLLITVVVALFLLATVAVLLTHDSAISANTSSREFESTRAEYVARAGMQHALWRSANSACMGDVTIPATTLGPDNYTATITGAAAGTFYTLTADQDAWIRSDQPTNNMGGDPNLHIKDSQVEQPLYRFDLSSLPAGAQINSAVASFYVSTDHPEGSVTVHRITAGWNEGDVTWNSISGSVDSGVLATIPAQPEEDVRVRVNITGQVQAWMNGEPNNGILLASTAPGIHAQYASREGAAGEHPRLEVVVGSGPASPVSIQATGTLDNGVTRTLSRPINPAYQPPDTVTLQLGTDSGADAMLDSFYPRNYGGRDFVQVNEDAGWMQRPVFRFGLGRVPAGAAVLSAQLQLRLRSIKTPGTATVHRVTRSWVEGTKSGTGTADGATWDTYDGTNNWTSAGGDFEAAAVAETAINGGETWVSWDIGPLVKQWLAGEPNSGLLLKSDGVLQEAEFYSKEEADATLRPRLTITYACECGTACMSQTGSGNILMVVDDANAPSTGDLNIKSYFESWGYTAKLIADHANQNAYDADLLVHDVAFVSESVDPIALSTKLSTSPIGIVSAESGLNNELGMSSTNGSPVEQTLDVVDTTHYITRVFSAGALRFKTVDTELASATGIKSTDAQILATADGQDSLIALETGGVSTKGGTVDTRRVLLPVGDSDVSWGYLTNNGQLVVQRSIVWAMGADGDSSGKLLMVVDDASSPLTSETDRKSLIESWGYEVTLISDHALQPEFDAALANVDVAYIAGSGSSAAVGTKLTGATVGVLSEDIGLVDELGIAEPAFLKRTSQSINVIDNTHYVTDGFGLGTLQLYTYVPQIWTVTGALAPGLQVLGETQDGGSSYPTGLAVLETGAALWGGGSAAGRRVQVAWSEGSFDINGLNDDGQTIMRRAIEWAAGTAAVTEPIAHWKLDEGSGTLAADSVGAHDGTLVNGPTWSGGALGGALSFDNSDDVVTVPHSDTLSLTSEFTLTAWITKDSSTDLDTAIEKSSSPLNRNYYLGTRTGEVIFGFTNSSFIWQDFATTSANLQDDTWYHIAGVFDNAADSVRIYLNGAELDNFTTSQEPVTNTAGIYLGRSPFGGAWGGSLDDLRIYNIALTATEIAELAAEGAPSGPVAHWKLDDGTGLTAVDSVGGHDGSLTNGPVWVAGQIGDALDFPGNDDYVNVPHADTLSLTNMTISLWLKADALNNLYQTMVRKKQQANYQLTTWNDEIVFAFNDGSGMKLFQTTNANLTTNQWYHVAATLDDTTGDINIYVDGTSIYNTTTPYHPLPNTEPLTIGGTPDASTYWPGLLDDVRLYDYPMTAAEVADLHAAGNGGGGGGGGGGSCDGNFRDNFNARSFGGSNGSLPWATDWIEVGESDGPTSGDIQVRENLSEFVLRTRDNDNGGEGVEREANLDGAATATLNYEYRRTGLDSSSDYTSVQISANGASGPWDELTRHAGSGNDSSYQSASHDITSFISATTRVRFITSSSMGGTDTVWFDNVEIVCTP